MAVIGVAEVEIRPDSTNFGKKAETDISRSMGGAADSVGKSAKLMGAALAGVFAVDKVIGFAGSVITAASDMGETLSKSKNVFGDQATAIEKWASTSAVSFGISKQAALAATAQYGDMFKQLGFTGDAAKNASTNLIKTAADLGSFHNVDPSDVLQRIGGALRGEFDSLQQLIPNLNAARVETEAMAASGKKNAAELTAQEKATATLAIIQKDGALAANDFAETSGGLANRQRILAAQFEDVKAKIGAGLLPVMTALAGFVLKNMIPAFESVSRIFGTVKGSLNAFTGAFKAGGDDITSSGFNGKLESVGLAGRKAFDEASSSVSAFVGAFKAGGNDITSSGFNGQIEGVALQARAVVDGALVAIRELWRIFGDDLIERVRIIGETVSGVLSGGLEIAKGVINTALALINGDWAAAWEGFKQILSGAWEVVVVSILKGGLDLFLNTLDLAWAGIKAGGAALIDGMREGIEEAWVKAKAWFVDLPNKIRELFAEARTWLVENGKSTLAGMLDGIEAAWDGDAGRGGGGGVKAWFQDLPNKIREQYKDARSWNVEDGKNTMGGFQDGLEQSWKSEIKPWFESLYARILVIVEGAPSWLVETGKKVAQGLYNGVFAARDKVLDIGHVLRDKAQDAVNGAQDWLVEAGRKVIQGLINGINSKLGDLRSKASEAAQSVKNFFPFSPAKEGPLSGAGNPYFSGQSIVKMLAGGMDSKVGDLRGTVSDLMTQFDFSDASVGGGSSRPSGSAVSLPTMTTANAGGKSYHIASLVIQNTKTLQENLDEVDRLAIPL